MQKIQTETPATATAVTCNRCRCARALLFRSVISSCIRRAQQRIEPGMEDGRPWDRAVRLERACEMEQLRLFPPAADELQARGKAGRATPAAAVLLSHGIAAGLDGQPTCATGPGPDPYLAAAPIP